MKYRILKKILAMTGLLSLPMLLWGNAPPAVVIDSAEMRANSTFMDITETITDADDGTVEVGAIGFIDGTLDLDHLVPIKTFVEGTAVNIGTAIATGSLKTLTWSVAADWNVDLGHIKVQIMAKDARALMPVKWTTLPAQGGNPAVTISKDPVITDDLWSIYFWLIATADPDITFDFATKEIRGVTGDYAGALLASAHDTDPTVFPFTGRGISMTFMGTAYLYKRMDLWWPSGAEYSRAEGTRGGFTSLKRDTTVVKGYPNPAPANLGSQPVVGFGTAKNSNFEEIETLPFSLEAFIADKTIIAISAESVHEMVLASDGTVGSNQTSPPAGLSGVTAIAAGGGVVFGVALKSNGTVAVWGDNQYGQTDVPSNLTDGSVIVTAIAAGWGHILALKSDGSVVSWGTTFQGESTVPAGLTGVIAIAAGNFHSFALKSDGTVVGWGQDASNVISTIPADLSGATALAISENGTALALINGGVNGTVVTWGKHFDISYDVPVGLTGVTAIAAGAEHFLALKSDGTVVAWGSIYQGAADVPVGLGPVSAIAAGNQWSMILLDQTP